MRTTPALVGFGDGGRGSQVKEYEELWMLETTLSSQPAGKSKPQSYNCKKLDSLLEPPERNASRCHLDYSLMRLLM